MNIKSALTNTLAVAAVAVAGFGATAETEDEPQLVTVTLKQDDPINTSSLVGLGGCAGWSDGSVAAIDPNKEYVVNGCNLRTPLSDSVGVYTDDVLTFGGGLLTFQGTGTGFSGAGSKLTLKCLDKTFVVPRLRVASGEFLMEHGQLTSALANDIVVSGVDWQVAPEATIWFSAFYVNSDMQSRRLVVKAPISGTGTLRCAGEGLSAGRADMPGKIVFENADNASFTGRFTTRAHANSSEPVEISFLTSESWFGNPSEECADGVVISDNAAIDFECSLQQTGANRGFTFTGSGSVISVAEGKTVTIDGRIVAPHGFVKKGRGELIIASTGSSVGGGDQRPGGHAARVGR